MLLDQVARLFPVCRNFVSHAGGERHELTWDGDASIRCVNGNGRVSHWLCQKGINGQLRIARKEREPIADGLEKILLAVLESAFYFYQDEDGLGLDISGLGDGFVEQYVQSGILGASTVDRKLFWQRPEFWLPNHQTTLPDGNARSHRHGPLRQKGDVGTTYRRFIPWLGRTLSFRGVRIEEDLRRFSRWMNDPFVSHFWEEQGDLEKHRNYLNEKQADQHSLSLFACLDGQPFGYFEVYWAMYDRIAPFCEAREHDRGWHALIGEDDCRGKPYVCAWLPSLTHYLFLDDDRTERIVVEPRVDNERMKKNLILSGYELIKDFDFPHKRASLFFEDRIFFSD